MLIDTFILKLIISVVLTNCRKNVLKILFPFKYQIQNHKSLDFNIENVNIVTNKQTLFLCMKPVCLY